MLFKKNNKNTNKYTSEYTNEYINKAELAAQQLKLGKVNYLPVIYRILASKNKEAVNYAAGQIAQYMRSLDSNRMIRLDEEFRQYTSMEWDVFWADVDLSVWKEKIDNQEDYLWVVRLGTFHPNGYFREKCIWELAGNNDSVKFALLRLNDWAEPVRDAAQAVCAWVHKLNAAELVECLPYLEKVKQGRRRDNDALRELEESIAQRIEEQLHNVDLKSLYQHDIKARKYLYRVLLEHRLLGKDEANLLLRREKNGQCQFLFMTMFLRCYEFSIEELDLFLQHKSKVVQRKALEQKYSIAGTYWEGLENMLLASSVGVRGLVSYILRKHTSIDIVAYYKERLETPQKKVCILGIGENGKAQDATVLMKYLESSEEGIVKSTLHAISLLLGMDAEDIFWKYLQDERPLVVRSAYREIVANGIVFGARKVYDLLMQTESELLRQKLAYQLLRERSWDRLPYILQLYCYEDEPIQTIVRRGIYGRNVYGQISQREAEHIRSILYDDRYGIPEYLQKSIEFDLRFVVKK